MKKIFAYLIFIFATLCTSGQNSNPQSIVFKVKSEYRTFCNIDKISIPEFQYFTEAYQLINIRKVFPHVSRPTTLTNKFGNTLVDLSLIYRADINKPSPNTLQICRTLKNSGWFEYVEQKNTHQLMFLPNDPGIMNQYYLASIHAYDGWDISKGDSTIVVGISDTGFDFTHNDLLGSVAYNASDPIDNIDNDNDGYIDNYRGWDLGMDDNNPQIATTADHGLFVSGIVGARTNNGVGISGVGCNIKILPIKTTNADNFITHGYESIVYAATHGCSVINCSWGGQITDGQFGEDVVNYATYNCNALMVAACGNSNNNLPLWPASYRNVMSVSATDINDMKANFSSYGWNVDISAPGDAIYSTKPNNAYSYSGGTSFSAPMVSACAAIVKSYFTNLSALQIAERLKVTADNIDALNATYAGMLGNGRLNLFRALTDIDMPSIKYDSPQFSNNRPTVGDTVSFNANFTNFLNPTEHLKISFSLVQGNATVIDSIISVAPLLTFQSYNNNDQPLKFVVSSNAPNSELVFKLTYTDTNYVGYEYVQLYVSQNYLNVDTNNITTTFTGNSRLGFADNYYHQGNGFKYMQTNQLFYMGGLIIGKNTENVSDNIYGESSFDNDFENISNPVKVASSTIADYEAVTQYNDNGAASNKMNLEITHHIYAWNQPECNDFVIHSFTVKNAGTTPQTGLYIGMYADWDIYISAYNKAKYEPSSKMIYAWSPLGGKYGGISALSPLAVNKYAFDNDGDALSLKISDGFSGIEKFTALTSNRDSAGYSGNGNDISTLLSYPQIDLLSGDSITLNFALVRRKYTSRP